MLESNPSSLIEPVGAGKGFTDQKNPKVYNMINWIILQFV